MASRGTRNLARAFALSLLVSACTETVPYGGRFEPNVYPVPEEAPPEPEARIPAPRPSPPRTFQEERIVEVPPSPLASDSEAPSRNQGNEKLAVAEDTEMVWPLLGAIVGGFRSAGKPDHRGIDLASHPGTLVVAAEAGRVVHVGAIQGYGNVVAVDHGESLTTIYAHLADSSPVRIGDDVFKGEAVGSVGTSGYLHFEIRHERKAVDPGTFFEAGPAPGIEAAGAEVREPSRPVPIGQVEPIEVVRPLGAIEEDATEEDATEEDATEEDATEEGMVASIEDGGSKEETEEPAAASVPIVDPALGSEQTIDPSGGVDQQATEVVALVVSNLAFVPAKLAYAAAGAVVGGFAYVVTGGAVTEVWEESLGGDYFLAREHLTGERPIRFRGRPISR